MEGKSMSSDLSNLNLGGNQTPITGPETITGVDSSQSTGSHKTGSIDKDTIERVGEAMAALYLQPNMSIPILFPPDGNSVAMIVQLGMDKICLAVLDSWSQSLQEIAEQKRRDDARAELNPTWQNFQQSAGVILSILTIFVRALFGTNAAEALQKGNGVDADKQMADRFANNLATWGASGALKGYILTVIDQMPSAAKLSEGDKVILGKQLEVMVLASALAALYKAETKWITPEEFVNILNNPSILNTPSAGVLASLIARELEGLPTLESERTLRMILEYVATNPDLPTLMDFGGDGTHHTSILNATAA